MCGASVSTDSTQCEYCHAKLAVIACPSCFGMMFVGSKFCSKCGAKAAREDLAGSLPGHCPRCDVELRPVKLGATTVDECAKCDGLWVDVASFEQICANREQQAAVLGAASPAPSPAGEAKEAGTVRYVPCPVCGNLMNQVNFAHCSRIIVDVCKGHGTWFERDELQRIVEFERLPFMFCPASDGKGVFG